MMHLSNVEGLFLMEGILLLLFFAMLVVIAKDVKKR